MSTLSFLESCHSHMMLNPKQLQRSTIVQNLVFSKTGLPALPEFRTNGLESETNDDVRCQIRVLESRILT